MLKQRKEERLQRLLDTAEAAARQRDVCLLYHKINRAAPKIRPDKLIFWPTEAVWYRRMAWPGVLRTTWPRASCLFCRNGGDASSCPSQIESRIDLATSVPGFAGMGKAGLSLVCSKAREEASHFGSIFEVAYMPSSVSKMPLQGDALSGYQYGKTFFFRPRPKVFGGMTLSIDLKQAFDMAPAEEVLTSLDSFGINQFICTLSS